MDFYTLKKDGQYIKLTKDGYSWTPDIREALLASKKYPIICLKGVYDGNIVAIHIEEYE